MRAMSIVPLVIFEPGNEGISASTKSAPAVTSPLFEKVNFALFAPVTVLSIVTLPLPSTARPVEGMTAPFALEVAVGRSALVIALDPVITPLALWVTT